MNTYLSINKSTTLKELTDVVSSQYIDTVIATNNLTRSPNIGKQLYDMQHKAKETTREVDWKQQLNLLNAVAGSAEVFEEMALLDSDGWKCVYATGTLPGRITIPESVKLPSSSNLIGNDGSISSKIYKKATEQLTAYPHKISESVFASDDSTGNIGAVLSNDTLNSSKDNPLQAYKIPWGSVSLYSSLADTTIDFPVYPDEISNTVTASYDTMPEILYQYEPWQVYKSSGPRSNTYTFKFHRDMWTGNHLDGLANKLVRFCQANCYPDYNGSAVNTATVTLLVNGKALITGIMTQCSDEWSGPLGQDGFWLMCTLNITITEVSSTPLNYTSVMQKGLIS